MHLPIPFELMQETTQVLSEVREMLRAGDRLAAAVECDPQAQPSALTKKVEGLTSKWWDLDHAMTPKCPDPDAHKEVAGGDDGNGGS